jgi:hypothetical protein
MHAVIRAVSAREKNNQGTNCIRKYSQNLKLHLEFNFSSSYTLLLIIIFLNVREYISSVFLQPGVMEWLQKCIGSNSLKDNSIRYAMQLP